MNEKPLVDYVVRDFIAADENFIFASWLRGLYYGNTWFREINKDIFMSNYHRALESCLQAPSVTIKVACLKDDPEVILGYAVLGANDTLHWVFVKSNWRGLGIAKALVPNNIKCVSHLTKSGLSILRRHPGVQFNPFNLT